MSTLLKKKYMAESRKRKLMILESVSAAEESRPPGCKRQLFEAASEGAASIICTAAVTPKEVRFDDKVTVITVAVGERLDAETLQRYRNDIWYTRDDYRTFWKDRIDSVQIWRAGHGDMETVSIDQQYTIRGLEAYVFSTSKELTQQRELYTVTVLKEQDCERIRSKVEGWSASALERAQNWAAQDAEAAARVNEQPSTRRSSWLVNHPSAIYEGSNRCLTPPRSPDSAVVDLTLEDDRLQDVKEMNKILIQHLQHQHEQKNQQAQQSALKNQRRSSAAVASRQRRNSMHHDQRPDSSSLYQRQEHRHDLEQCNSILAQRRNSVQMAPQYQQEKAQQRRNSIADDFERHMSFCNQLLSNRQELAQRHRGAGRLDAVALGMQQYYQQDTSNCNDVAVFHRNIHHDSLSPNVLRQQEYRKQRRYSLTHNEHQCRDYSVPTLQQPVKYDYQMQGSDTLQLQQQQYWQQRQEAAYNDSVTSFSRLRRDSLAGHFL